MSRSTGAVQNVLALRGETLVEPMDGNAIGNVARGRTRPTRAWHQVPAAVGANTPQAEAKGTETDSVKRAVEVGRR